MNHFSRQNNGIIAPFPDSMGPAEGLPVVARSQPAGSMTIH
jgi:hypothetical protein